MEFCFSKTALVCLFLCISTVCIHESTSDDVEDDFISNVDVPYVTPKSHPDAFFSEHFDDLTSYEQRWIKSQTMKEETDIEIAKYDGIWKLEAALNNALNGDLGLVLKSKAKHAAVSSRFKIPFVFSDKPFIVQYEINFQNGQDCGGGYVKLITHDSNLDLRNFGDKTPYTIMFGPDKCGSDTKLHFIFRHKNPLNHTVSEKHCKKLGTKERSMLDEVLGDKRPHLYRLLIQPDSTYEISIDKQIVNHGSLHEDFTPPVNPPSEIDDPNDIKPADWDVREKIPDPEASKPDDWDESQPRKIIDDTATMPHDWLEKESAMIPDPEAVKPKDWDNDMDGEWEPPLIENEVCKSVSGCGKWNKPTIDNPAYKGKWSAPLIKNPSYKGIWKPKKIPNPDYFYDTDPFRMSSIGAIGIELWSMSDDIYFDNIIISDNPSLVDEWTYETFDLKVQKLDVNDASLLKRILRYSNRNPWLYAVYVVLIGLPLVLIFTFCCSSVPSVKKAPSTADTKKTDEVTADDVPTNDEEFEEITAADEEDEMDFVNDRKLGSEGDETPGRRTSARKRRARKD